MATFFVNAFVRRVNRRIDIRIVRFTEPVRNAEVASSSLALFTKES